MTISEEKSRLMSRKIRRGAQVRNDGRSQNTINEKPMRKRDETTTEEAMTVVKR